MKDKIIKLLAFLIIIILILSCSAPLVNAGLVSNARGESGPAPRPPTPSDSPQTRPDPTPKPDTDTGPKVVTITHKTSINGYVYEDIGQTIGTNGTDSTTAHIPIAGVTVNLMSKDKVVSSIVTDSSGYYSFSPSPGTYTVEFRYGDVGGKSANDINLIRNILKYNGHDYITVQTPKDQEYMDVQKIEIQQSGKGSAQVFLAVDCSAVMRNTQVTVNGKTKTRLQIASESAKMLIDKLIESGDNIYIGLVFFSGTCYRAVSLTKDTEILYQALDDIVANEWQTPNTNIVGALDKVMESYYNNDIKNSNRYLAVLSDGIPTSDGTNETYYDMSDEEIMNVLETVKKSTKNKLKEIKEKGVKIFSLMVKGDEEENAWAQDIFGQPTSDIFISAQDGEEIIKSINKDLQEYIISTTETKEYTSGYNVLAGYEDAERRKEVDDNFETFKYDNTIMFKQIDSYNATSEDINKATELSSKTWMRVVGGTYKIESVPTPSTQYKRDDEGKIITIIKHVASAYSNQNIVLAQRPALSLVTTTTTTAMEISLADHSVLTQQKVNPDTELPLIFYMDDEIAHGATVKLEYTIRIKNDSSIQCNYLELINHVPRGFVFAQDTVCITEVKTNKEYGWEQTTLQSLYDNGYISSETLEKYNNRDTLKIILDNNGQGANGFYIPPGGEYDIKLTVSKVISRLNNLEVPLENVSEVLVYKDSSNRRMAYLNKTNMASGVTKQQLAGVYPGDSFDKDFSITKNRAFIIPPTGDNISIVFTTLETLLVIAVGVVILRIVKRNNRK